MVLFCTKRSLTLFELLVVMCIILILIGNFAIYANINLKIGREIVLQNELMNIRMSIEHYRIVNGKIPQDLRDLIKQRLTTKSSYSKIPFDQFLKSFRVDREGYLLDPFMKRYYYDNQEGKIRSQTKGYENW